MKVLGGVAHEANALVLAVDHFGKDANVGVRDSSAKEGSGDLVLALLANRDIEGNVTKPRLAIRKARAAPTGEVIPFATRQVVIDEKDGDNAITTLIIEWRRTEPLDDESAGDEKQWAKGLVIFMKALGSAVADTGRRVRPFADGSEAAQNGRCRRRRGPRRQLAIDLPLSPYQRSSAACPVTCT